MKTMLRRTFLLAGCAVPALLAQDAAKTIILVRHAEKSAPKGDVPLSAAGRERSARLARVLQDVPIGTILTSEMMRTRQTAEPVAKEKRLKPVVIPAADISALIGAIKDAPAGRAVLVVHHSNTIPEIAEKLGARGVAAIGEEEYDRLLILTVTADKASLLSLRY